MPNRLVFAHVQGEPRSLEWRLFVGTSEVSWELWWRVVEGLKTGKTNPCGALVGGLVGPLVDPLVTRGSNSTFACSVKLHTQRLPNEFQNNFSSVVPPPTLPNKIPKTTR